MDTRPEMKKYRASISTTLLSIIAALTLVAGIVLIIIGIAAGSRENAALGVVGLSSTGLGILLVLVSANMFVFTNIAEDIHWKAYLAKYYGEEAVNYHQYSLQKLHSIESMLRNGNISVDSSVTSDSRSSYPQNMGCPKAMLQQYPYTLQEYQENFTKPEMPKESRVKYESPRKKRTAYRDLTADSADYQTQYKQPAQQGKSPEIGASGEAEKKE